MATLTDNIVSNTSGRVLGPATDTELPVLLLGLLIPALLIGSYRAFTRGESMRSSQRIRHGLIGLCAGALIFGLPGLLIVSTMFK
jgi:hypothetical protein